MTPEELAIFAGAALSLVFAYFPWLKDRFDKIDSKFKPLLNAGILLVAALVLVGAGCLDFANYFECSQAGLLEVAQVWILALIANIATYQTLVRQFKQAK